MAKKAKWLLEEVADFLATCPSAEEMLAYRSPQKATARLAALLTKAKTGTLLAEEQWEIDQFEHIEMLLQSIKAKLRPAKPIRV
jgi:hypothetical protein